MITYQQQLQQQQFIQFLNNLPQLAELFLVGNDTIIVSNKVSKKCKWRESKNEIKSINKWSIFFLFKQEDEKKRKEEERKQAIATKNEAERKRKDREVGFVLVWTFVVS